MKNLQSKQTGQWRWINSQGGKYLQAEALRKQGLVHGFFTKEWNNQSPKQIVNSLDRSLSVHTCKQVHGSTVIEASKTSQSHLPEADGLISDQKNQSLWIYTADCIPILLADPINSIVGAIHAGWKGLSKHILSEAIRRMEYLGADKSQLIIALGPSISKANYPVDFHVAESIYTRKSNENELKVVKSKNRIIDLVNLGIAEYDKDPQKLLLDIRLAAASQLFKTGIKKEQLSISPLCTFHNQDLFNSWRRDKPKKIVQWSAISN